MKEYYWSGMHRDIAAWVKACISCMRRKSGRLVHSDEPASICEALGPWHSIAIDLVTAGASIDSVAAAKYILTIMCLFTRYVIAVPLPNKKATSVADALFVHAFGVHGLPATVRSDEGKEFVNAALTSLYRRWGIEPITTGGYRPWANPVERYHRYLNSSMTVLSTTFGEDWTRYLQAAVFSYNSSVCRSTGYSPYYLFHGRECTLLEAVTIAPPFGARQEPHDICKITKELEGAYRLVATQQARVAKLNRERLAKGVRSVTYKMDDHVLHWEPDQSKYLGAKSADAESRKHAPRAWKYRWTGPHRVVNVSQGSYNQRYTILHTRRGEIENVKADKLYPYTPWSEALPSTSPKIDALGERRCRIGTRCKNGSLFITPLDHPWAFGVGKMLLTNANGTVHFHWYEAPSPDRPGGPYLPCWWDGAAHYRSPKPSDPSHVPFTGRHTEAALMQADLAFHGIALDAEGHLPKAVLTDCSGHGDIWWTMRATRSELKRAAQPKKRPRAVKAGKAAPAAAKAGKAAPQARRNKRAKPLEKKVRFDVPEGDRE